MYRLKINKIIIFFTLLIVFIPRINAVVEQTSEFYVNDYANILSETTENYILNKSVELNNINGSQIVVVTVKSLDGISIEDYSLQLFREFGIGDKEKNNGLLFLIALEEREFRIEVGYGLEGILPDGKVGRLEDVYIIPYFKSNKFDEGIKSGYDVFYSEIINYDKSYSNNNALINTVKGVNLYILFIILNVLTGTIFGVIRRIIKKKNKDNFDNSSMFKCNVAYVVVLILLLVIQSILNFGRISILLLGINILICATVYAPHTKLPSGYSTSSGRTRSSYGRSSSSRSYRGGGGSSGGGGASRKF